MQTLTVKYTDLCKLAPAMPPNHPSPMTYLAEVVPGKVKKLMESLNRIDVRLEIVDDRIGMIDRKLLPHGIMWELYQQDKRLKVSS